MNPIKLLVDALRKIVKNYFPLNCKHRISSASLGGADAKQRFSGTANVYELTEDELCNSEVRELWSCLFSPFLVLAV